MYYNKVIFLDFLHLCVIKYIMVSIRAKENKLCKLHKLQNLPTGGYVCPLLVILTDIRGKEKKYIDISEF